MLVVTKQHPYHLHYYLQCLGYPIYHLCPYLFRSSNSFLTYLLIISQKEQIDHLMYKSNVQRQRISQWYHHRISLSDIITALREDFGRWFDDWRRFSHLAFIALAADVRRVIVGWSHLMQLSKEGACKSGYPTHKPTLHIVKLVGESD